MKLGNRAESNLVIKLNCSLIARFVPEETMMMFENVIINWFLPERSPNRADRHPNRTQWSDSFVFSTKPKARARESVRERSFFPAPFPAPMAYHGQHTHSFTFDYIDKMVKWLMKMKQYQANWVRETPARILVEFIEHVLARKLTSILLLLRLKKTLIQRAMLINTKKENPLSINHYSESLQTILWTDLV